MSVVSSVRSSSPQVFIESEEKFVEATEADLEEYAKRIGIDPVQEEFLLPLANEGLMHRLPSNWKPCYEPHRKAWYYYNNETLKSQWEHPMDGVYRQKVADARIEHAMNRMQSIDLSSPPTLKNLPPLRLSGPGLKPLNSLVTPSNSGSINGETNHLFNEPIGAPKNKLQPLTIPSQLKKPTGLVVTGGGASFLKSSSQKRDNLDITLAQSPADSNDSLQMRNKMIIPSAVPLGNPGQSSLKGILANSMSRSVPGEIKNSLTNWDPNPSFMTGQEKNLWKSLEEGKSRQRTKASVKFNLDENPELHFETSQSEKNPEDDEAETGDSTSPSNTEEDEDMSKSLSLRQEKVDREYKPLVPKNSEMSLVNGSSNAIDRNPTQNTSISLPEPKTPPTSKPLTGSQIGAGEKPSERDLNELNKVAKDELRAEMEAHLKVYQETLELERKQREIQMKKHMEQVLEETKHQNEEAIQRFKSNLEKQGQTDLEKARRDLDAHLNQEINKLREENKAKIQQEKEQLENEQQKTLQTMAEELSKVDREEFLKEKRKEALAVMEAELQEELKSVKEAMREDQKRQTQQMKDYHASFLYKLKGEFKTEEDNVRRQQTQLLAEIVTAQKNGNDEIIETFKAKQEAEIAEMKAEYELKRQAMDMRLNESLSSLAGSGTKLNLSEAKTTESKKDRELEMLKIQYEELEEKYKALKQSLRNVVAVERERNTNKLKYNKTTEQEVMLNTSFVELNSGNGDLSSSPSEEAATSLDISGSDARKMNRQTNSKNRHQQSTSRIDQLRADSKDRVNKALTALETLREQILEIKSEQNLSALRENTEVRRSPETGKRGGNGKYTNVYPTGRRNSDTNRQPSIKSPEGLRVHVSRSATDIKAMRNGEVEDNEVEVSDEESRHLVVEEAKDFIKSQKRRLSRNIPGYGLKPRNSSSTMSPGLKLQEKESSSNLRRKEYHYSETESSGVGSLKSFPPGKDSSQVAKDIDCILGSLKKLDKQMKYLWSVVGKQRPGPNGHYESTSRLTNIPNMVPVLTPLVHPVSPPALQQLTRLVEKNPDYPLMTTQYNGPMSTTNELTSRYSLGPTFFNETNANLMSNIGKLSHTNFNLDEHVNNLRNTQARISQLPQDDMSVSLREKTRDLREWLEKF